MNDIKYIDVGINLFNKQFFKKEKTIIENALDNGVFPVLTGVNINISQKSFMFAQKNNLCSTAGIHPHNAKEFKIEDIKTIKELCLQKEVVAVGECGLDFNRMFSTKEEQINCFIKQIELAEELDMPLFLHERDAVSDFLNIIKEHDKIVQKSVIHCFSGSVYELDKYLNAGFYIGITGFICDDKRNKDLKEAVKIIPVDRLVIETDSPFMKPKNIYDKNRTNVPENIKYVCKTLSEYMNIEEEKLINHTFNNTLKLFPRIKETIFV